jgi:hypothetical protein
MRRNDESVIHYNMSLVSCFINFVFVFVMQFVYKLFITLFSILLTKNQDVYETHQPQTVLRTLCAQLSASAYSYGAADYR